MKRNPIILGLLLVVAAGACQRNTDFSGSGNVNIRLSLTPQRIAATDGTAVLGIEIDNFSGHGITLGDIKIATSAGFDKVGAVMATGANRFSVALQGLNDISESPVSIKVTVFGVSQSIELEVVPGPPNGLKLEVSSDFVSADIGEVDLTVRLRDSNANVTAGPIALGVSAGVLSSLVLESDGTYSATLSGLTDVADSPVEITASFGDGEVSKAIQILAGELDHFTVSEIRGPLTVASYEEFLASARDRNGNLVTAFEGPVNVRTTRGIGDVEVKSEMGPVTFTRNFAFGRSQVEQFRIRTPAPAPGIGLVVYDSFAHTGSSNVFEVFAAPANLLMVQTQSGYDTIVPADGCVLLKQNDPRCTEGAIKEGNRYVQGPMATRIEMLLCRYDTANGSPDDCLDGTGTLLGGRGAEMVVTMRDADGNVFDKNSPRDDERSPYLGPVEDPGNGRYYVNLYNLRDAGKSPYTVTARFVSLIGEREISVVPGDLDEFEFPEIPAQRTFDSNDPTGVISSFFISLTAADRWGNQVYSFQDTVAVLQDVNGVRQQIATSPPMLLGGSLPFLVNVAYTPELDATGVNRNARLVAAHGSGTSGGTNTFKAYPSSVVDQPTTDFVILLPGQYDNPPPTGMDCINFFSTAPCADITPPLGNLSSADTPIDQEVGRAFQILILARTRIALPVLNFAGSILLDGVEVLDDTCTPGGAATETPRGLSPQFGNYLVGTGAVPQPGQIESACYVWVRATNQASAANIVANPGRSSSIPLTSNVSSDFTVLSAPATGLRVRTIPTPQMATANPDGGKYTFVIDVQAIDDLGNPTNNVICSAPVLTTSLGANVLQYSGPIGFDANGLMTIDDAWLYLTVAQNEPRTAIITADCGTAGMVATSNSFQVINQGVAGYSVVLTTSDVRAHEPFKFTAIACASVDGNGDCLTTATGFYYQVSMTDSTGTLFPSKTEAFEAGVLSNQEAMIDTAGKNIRICLQGAGAKACSAPIEVRTGALSHFEFDTSDFPSVVTVGDTYIIDVKPIDAGGNEMAEGYAGRIYLNNNYGTVSFDRANVTGGNNRTADVETDQNGFLVYKGTSEKLRVIFSEYNLGDFLSVTDNRGHSGFSLPHMFRVEYGPVNHVEILESDVGPCRDVPATPYEVRRGAYFTLCVLAYNKKADGRLFLKKDYNSTIDEVFSSPAVLPSTLLPFNAGIARVPLYFAPDTTSGDYSATYRVRVAGTLYPASFKTLQTRAPIASYLTTTTVIPQPLQTDEPFKLLLEVRRSDNNLADSSYQGALLVTDTTDSIRPACGVGQKPGTCGYFYPGATTVVTGDFTDPLPGQREQWFTIPTELSGNYIYVSDGFGKKIRVGPFDVAGNLSHFLVAPLPSKIAAGSEYPLRITAVNTEGYVMTSFNVPLKLSNFYGTVSPDSSGPILLRAVFVNGVLDTTFTIYASNPGGDYLTVEYNGKTGISTSFISETRDLTSLTWDQIPSSQPGYVDFTVGLTARDQFDELFLYGGNVRFSPSGNFVSADGSLQPYAVHPTMSANFSSGVLTNQKLSIDGGAGQTTLTATALGAGVSSAARPVTVTASTVASFGLAFPANITQGTPKAGCSYTMTLVARDSNGNPVGNFSGRARLRWGFTTQLAPVYGNSTGISPNITPSFANGTVTFDVTLNSQQSYFNVFYPDVSDPSINIYVEDTLIQGWTYRFDLQPAGTCP